MTNEFGRQVAEQQIGGKTRLRDFDGVGETTLREMRSKGFRGLDDVQSATTAELAEVDGIGQKKAKQIKQQAPRDTATRRTSGSVSAAGIRSPVGDFKVGLGDKDSIDARHTTRARGDNAVRTDNRRRAPITTDKEKWVDNPGRYDYPGVDTPTEDPRLRRSDLTKGDVDRDDLTKRGKNFYDEIRSLQDKRQRQQQVDVSAPGNGTFLSDDQAAAALDDADVNRELFQAQATAADVSLSPGEAFDGVGTGGRANRSNEGDVPTTDSFARYDMTPEEEQQVLDKKAAEAASSRTPKGLIESFAGGREADMAFTKAEEERAGAKDPYDITAGVGGGAGGGLFEPDRADREAIRKLEMEATGSEPEQIEKVRLFDDPPEEAVETFANAADRIVENRGEITDPDRTDTAFFEEQTIDRLDSLRSQVR